MVSQKEELGGDPPCWAHLFDEPGEACDGAEPTASRSSLSAENSGVGGLLRNVPSVERERVNRTRKE